ncbi:MAG: ATP-binding cassette domain-containing protein [Gammaproteobacteria bacterium]|nr:ATP-binding cassette domain-containing protein [Gammaproteobacteria bacterium]
MIKPIQGIEAGVLNGFGHTHHGLGTFTKSDTGKFNAWLRNAAALQCRPNPRPSKTVVQQKHGPLIYCAAVIELRKLALRRGVKALLTDTTVTIRRGARVGVVGRNGSGKSSLFAMLLGQLPADEGELEMPCGLAVAHVSQRAPSGTRSALDTVLDGDHALRAVEAELLAAQSAQDGARIAGLHGRLEDIDGYTARARAEQILMGLGFDKAGIERPVDELSGGWRRRLSLAQALIAPCDLLLLDEPTNHLDLDAVIWLESWLAHYRGTLLVISHDRDFLDGVVDHVLSIEGGKGTMYRGNLAAYESQKAAHRAQQLAVYGKQQKRVAQIRRFVDRFRAKATKARQAQSRLKTLQRMEHIELAHSDRPYRFTIPEPAKLPTPLLRVEDAAVGYGSKTVVSGVRLTLTPGKRIGLVGHNGAGKSTLIKLLAGVLQPLDGIKESSRGLSVGYFDQHQLATLDPRDSPLDFMRRTDPRAEAQRLRDYVGGFGFQGDIADAASAHFSGGERARLVLAGLVWNAPNVLLLDEPTNHLDLDMRDALVEALQNFPGALITVSHDRHMLKATTDELWLVDGGTLTPFAGDLDDYRRWLSDRGDNTRGGSTRGVDGAGADANPHATAGVQSPHRRLQRQAEAAKRRERQPFKRQAEALEAKLEKLNTKRAQVEHALSDTALYSDENRGRLTGLLKEQNNLKEQIGKTEMAWFEAVEALEAFDAQAS